MNLAQQSIRERLPLDVQRRLVAQASAVAEASPYVQPIARGNRPMSVLVTCAGKLGWVGSGEYRYSKTDSRGRPWPAIPEEWIAIADRVAGGHFPWDCAIVNRYRPGASLGWHRDLSERDRSLPIVTISLGAEGRWGVRRTEESPASWARLESGDVTLLCREHSTRLALHTIARTIPCPLLSPVKGDDRISITLRCAA